MLDRRKTWTDEDVALLVKQYPIVGCRIPRLRLNRNASTIRWKARKLGLSAPFRDNYAVPLESVSSEKRAYLAGLIDGEGSIYIAANRRNRTVHHFLEMSIANTARSVIDWLIKELGGTEKLAGKATRPGCPDQWSWVVRGYNAEPYLKAVLPYLVIKRRQADLALRFLKVSQCGLSAVAKSLKHAEMKRQMGGLNCLKGKAR